MGPPLLLVAFNVLLDLVPPMGRLRFKVRLAAPAPEPQKVGLRMSQVKHVGFDRFSRRQALVFQGVFEAGV